MSVSPPPRSTSLARIDLPPGVLDVAQQSLGITCQKLLNLEVQSSNETVAPDPETAERAGCITMTTATGSWNLVVALAAPSAEHLARQFLDLDAADPVEDTDIVDTLNEVVNILAGQVKTEFGSAANDWRLGLPIYLEGPAWFQKASRDKRFAARNVFAPGMLLQVVVCWYSTEERHEVS